MEEEYLANLVILESPSKAATIKGYLGSNYKVVASKGHVRDLPKSTLGVDIENNFEPRYINIRGRGDLIKELRREAKKAKKVYLMTDPDREGEAIAWHLANALNIPVEKALRAPINEVTKTAVKAAVKSPRKIDMNLVNAQQTRRILDRIVGYKLSPYLWKSVRSGLSAGRVQSVATRMIVDRERERDAFVPVEYWSIEADLLSAEGKPFKAKFWGVDGEAVSLNTKEETDAILESCKNGDFIVSSVRKAKKQKHPAPPFTTSSLLVEASRKLGFQSQRIMRTAQELYEGIDLGAELGGAQGLITYMRTDSIRISEQAAETAKKLITEQFGENYLPDSQRSYKTDAGAQDAHEAIRPANPEIHPDKIKSKLTPDQYKLYKLIWNRFIASQMASALLDTVSADIVNGKNIFRASGYTIAFKGYMSVYEDSEPEEDKSAQPTEEKMAKTLIPELAKDDKLELKELVPAQHFTEPPARYTEASLINRFKELGIGRPSTYTPTITTIISRGYVEREGKSLKPTSLGFTTTELMEKNFNDIVDYKFTANMEEELDDIENGKRVMNDVLGAFYAGFSRDLERAAENLEEDKVETEPQLTDIICDKCGARMIVKTGRYGRFAACPNYPTCKNTKPITPEGEIQKPQPAPDGMTCDECGSPMVVRSGRWGNFYACSRYPECKFTKRIDREIGVKCPDCGGEIVVRRTKNRRIFYGCSNYPDCEFVSYSLPTKEKCPDCGSMLLLQKGKKSKLVCRDKECGYSRENDLPEIDIKTGEKPDEDNGSDE
ncbi:MAG: type I DNA topoisomerase [Clostridiales bacterium]|nr:type I DNA topoisomerase [Clostridiales bacterium]